MKQKYVKFKNDHPSGAFQEGDVIMIPEASLDAYMESGHVEKSTKKEYEEFQAEKAAKVVEANKKAATEHQEKQEGNTTQHTGQNPNPEIDEDEETEEIKLHELTEEDLTKYPNETKGFKVGDKVELNPEGDFVISEDELFVLGNVLSSLNGEGDGPFFYTLTENDLEQNSDTDLCDGFKVGEEIEVNDQNVWLLGDDEKLIKRVIEE